MDIKTLNSELELIDEGIFTKYKAGSSNDTINQFLSGQTGGLWTELTNNIQADSEDFAGAVLKTAIGTAMAIGGTIQVLDATGATALIQSAVQGAAAAEAAKQAKQAYDSTVGVSHDAGQVQPGMRTVANQDAGQILKGLRTGYQDSGAGQSGIDPEVRGGTITIDGQSTLGAYADQAGIDPARRLDWMKKVATSNPDSTYVVSNGQKLTGQEMQDFLKNPSGKYDIQIIKGREIKLPTGETSTITPWKASGGDVDTVFKASSSTPAGTGSPNGAVVADTVKSTQSPTGLGRLRAPKPGNVGNDNISAEPTTSTGSVTDPEMAGSGGTDGGSAAGSGLSGSELGSKVDSGATTVSVPPSGRLIDQIPSDVPTGKFVLPGGEAKSLDDAYSYVENIRQIGANAKKMETVAQNLMQGGQQAGYIDQASGDFTSSAPDQFKQALKLAIKLSKGK